MIFTKQKYLAFFILVLIVGIGSISINTVYADENNTDNQPVIPKGPVIKLKPGETKTLTIPVINVKSLSPDEQKDNNLVAYIVVEASNQANTSLASTSNCSTVVTAYNLIGLPLFNDWGYVYYDYGLPHFSPGNNANIYQHSHGENDFSVFWWSTGWSHSQPSGQNSPQVITTIYGNWGGTGGQNLTAIHYFDVRGNGDCYTSSWLQ